MRVTLLDYGAGNVRSVVNALTSLGAKVHFVEGPEDILSAERLVFPGVGHFGSIMQALREKGLLEPLREYLRSGRPFLGICLGLQVLFEGSEEAPGVAGLGVFPGFVRRFRVNLPVPHIGWNGLRPQKPSRLFQGLSGEEKFYFVHSYYVEPADPSLALTFTDYGVSFVSAIEAGPVVALQFHPEKSGPAGLKILENFLRGEGEAVKPPRVPQRTRLAKRIIACLDVRSDDQGRLVVTKGLQYDVREAGRVRDMGDPVELAQRYYEEGADEITFLNITGFRHFPLQDQPMLEVLRRTSERVFVPLTIGGGIRDFTDRDGRSYTALEVASAYFRAGADKVSIGSDAVYIVEDYLRRGPSGRSSIETISRVYGRQAVVISIDPKRHYVKDPSETPHPVIETALPGPNGERYCWFQCTVKGGREARDVDAITLARVCEELGAGEILLNSIDRDGTNLGYDLELIQAVSEAVSIPVIASSGAGCEEHFYEVFARTRAEAALAAGIFHRRQVEIPAVKRYLREKGIEVRLV
ncbi:imidazole glycerol phosphate synthase subunit HisF [Thermosulfurimonas marina]|uniref:Imidazole glycerol phosphate synthase subunit HisH n=1 Tax=Thermosulfurimonas marina TaxID=2047767 RepID=A0A6H1WUB9_9BACT|nr:imidazole glycerol phosphate synthase subunit HisF [Thermosulfurimonas marina]QJA06771.1 imidazole glycerol phosphate synthase subunit HisF [Thermosulfurimonas marina]